MYIFVDIASIAKRALLAGKDLEQGYETVDDTGRSHWVNSADYGLGNLVNSFAVQMKNLDINPKDMILVFDGKDSLKGRREKYSAYKANRHRAEGFYTEYNKMMAGFKRYMADLGATLAQHDEAEADDLIAYLCRNLTGEPVLVWTNDNDLVTLSRYGHVSVYSNNQLNPKPYGDFPAEFIPVYKATVGDSSDNIKGAHGFGPAAFAATYAAFGDNGLRQLRKAITTKSLAELHTVVDQVPALKKLIDYAEDVYTAYYVADFHEFRIVPEKIQWTYGLCRPNAVMHPALRPWAQTVTGVDAGNFDSVFAEIRSMADRHEPVALDIETSTPEESDDWLFNIKGKENAGVDVLGSTLTGLSLTMGGNFHKTYYFSVNHAATDNITLAQMQSVLDYLNGRVRFVIHNVNFELPVLHNTFGFFLRDVDDTKLMASYVDENESLGLKPNSLRWLGYGQQTYEDTVRDSDGRLRKMDELTLDEVLSYGADDTVCTAALYQIFKLRMELEQTWQTYRDVEIGAAYWVAQAFLDGVKTDRVKLAEMTARDAKAKAELEETLQAYLIKQGWPGSVFEAATAETWCTPEWVKYAFHILTGRNLETRVRKIERLADEAEAQGAPQLADALRHGDINLLNSLVKARFAGRPDFNAGSPKQMQHLMYDVMNLPIRVRNKPTDLMRVKGLEGTPQTDDAAINLAMHYDIEEGDERRDVLKALLGIKMYNTREGLYYKTYPKLPHWKTNRIHASNNQCSTVTRRFSCSTPNLSQLAKGAGDFRTVFVPHHKNAMIVSLDFSAQELRIMADYSKDENMLACYMGETRKDLHSMTAAEIAKMPYEDFTAALYDESHSFHKKAKETRKLAKTVNFGSEYGAQAPKMAQTLMVTEAEAESYLQAKYRTFAGSEAWKKKVVEDAARVGYSTTKLGARRHLNNLKSANSWERAKAERQAVNFKIQGSGAEMTKLAMGRIWQAGIREKYDIRFFSPIHDELVFSIAIDDMPKAVPEIHRCMTAPYADMAVPVESSVSFGWNFGDQHEMGDGVIPTPENVQKLIDKLLKETL
ncbi:DNA polymerase [Neisseria leonii]|uniref:DNA polymerase I n=1 Tax=Neisseria leonii TaxID=2995413 RepID=A0A9X4E3V6_9NEIS|nr:DNA polymerase [Neisseria sp. 51.81]MDD9328234.1 DNA polymerase [Neisseria sp. 51.81]